MLFDFAKNLFSNKKKVLIINEGDRQGINLSDGLSRANFEVVSVSDNKEIIPEIKKIQPDLIIILISSSQERGWQLLETLKNSKIFIPTMLALDSDSLTLDIEQTKKYGIVDTITSEEIKSQAALRKIEQYFKVIPKETITTAGIKLKKVDAKGEIKNATVLLVEDYKELREALSRKLGASGYDVFLAEDGEMALEGLEVLRPDVILLDIIMPGINGFEVLKRIKKDGKISKIPIIMLSNLGEEEDIQRSRVLGAVDYMVKANVTTDDIVAKLGYYIKN